MRRAAALERSKPEAKVDTGRGRSQHLSNSLFLKNRSRSHWLGMGPPFPHGALPHNVEALEDSAFLLTIARPEDAIKV